MTGRVILQLQVVAAEQLAYKDLAGVRNASALLISIVQILKAGGGEGDRPSHGGARSSDSPCNYDSRGGRRRHDRRDSSEPAHFNGTWDDRWQGQLEPNERSNQQAGGSHRYHISRADAAADAPAAVGAQQQSPVAAWWQPR